MRAKQHIDTIFSFLPHFYFSCKHRIVEVFECMYCMASQLVVIVVVVVVVDVCVCVSLPSKCIHGASGVPSIDTWSPNVYSYDFFFCSVQYACSLLL